MLVLLSTSKIRSLHKVHLIESEENKPYVVDNTPPTPPKVSLLILWNLLFSNLSIALGKGRNPDRVAGKIFGYMYLSLELQILRSS